jgi:hypothetical protein
MRNLLTHDVSLGDNSDEGTATHLYGGLIRIRPTSCLILYFEEFELLFVMSGTAVVTELTFAIATRWLDRSPLKVSASTIN